MDTALVLGEWLQDAAVGCVQAIGEGAKVERITVKRYRAECSKTGETCDL